VFRSTESDEISTSRLLRKSRIEPRSVGVRNNFALQWSESHSAALSGKRLRSSLSHQFQSRRPTIKRLTSLIWLNETCMVFQFPAFRPSSHSRRAQNFVDRRFAPPDLHGTHLIHIDHPTPSGRRLQLSIRCIGKDEAMKV